MPIEQHRYGRFETWRLGVLWRAETTDYGRTYAANGETEAKLLPTWQNSYSPSSGWRIKDAG